MAPSEHDTPHAPAIVSRETPPDLLLVGTDYRSAPLELRERVRFPEAAAEEMLIHLLARPEIAEAYLLSTCNRTEVLVRARDGEAAYRAVVELVFHPRAPELAEEGRLYIRRDEEAAKHLLSVASGLESMVLGEPEILGQVRQAMSLAEAVGAHGKTLTPLLRTAVDAGGRARKETGIAAGAVSLGYSVVELTRTIFNEPRGARALLLGAGETGRLVAQALVERGVEDLVVANRSPERTARFLEEFPTAEGIPFERRHAALNDSDIVVATTGAPEPILLSEDFRDALRLRGGRPLLAVDLGVPRNIDPGASRVENLFLQDIDSLQSLIRRNLRQRREEAPRVQEIIERELERYYLSFQRRQAEPIVASLQRQAEAIRCQELEMAAARFPPEMRDELDRMTRALVRKILHHPSHRLRSGGEEHDRRLDLVRELFQLDAESDGDGGDP